jgi:hypothetical protein
MLEKASVMSSVHAAIESLAGPYAGNRKSWLAAVAKATGVSYRTVKSLWYREIDDEDHLAAKAIKQKAVRLKAQQEAKDLATQFETIAGGLNASDPDFYSADITALVHASRILRGLDRA